MRRIVLLTCACLSLLVVGACRNDGRDLPAPRPEQNLSISSTAEVDTTDPDATGDAFDTALPPAGEYEITAPWRDGADIDARYSCDGVNVAPALSWSAAPEGTVEIAITLTDLDVPGFVHWAIAGLAPTSIAIAEDTVPIGAYEAANSLGDIGYTGPCPPAGQQHLYLVTVHYLAEITGYGDGAAGLDLIAAIEAVEIARADVSGIFTRL